MALILRYFTEFGSLMGALRKSGWRCHRKKVYVRYLISWWGSCWLWHCALPCKILSRYFERLKRTEGLQYINSRLRSSAMLAFYRKWFPRHHICSEYPFVYNCQILCKYLKPFEILSFVYIQNGGRIPSCICCTRAWNHPQSAGFIWYYFSLCKIWLESAM